MLRPFQGRVDEPDWVALRELVPSATAPLTLSADHLTRHPEHAGRQIVLGTVLPLAWPALVRALASGEEDAPEPTGHEGEVLLAAQTAPRGGDPSQELAQALLAGLDREPGGGITGLTAADADAPRLQDLLDPAPIEVTVHDGFGWWVTDAKPEGEVAASLERADATVIPTTRLTQVTAAYWCRIPPRTHLRWVLPDEEEALLDAFARLAAADGLSLVPDSRFVGSFRAAGLVVPVWDLPDSTEAAAVEEPAVAFRARLDEALAASAPLSSEQRRARAGVVSRQLTLR